MAQGYTTDRTDLIKIAGTAPTTPGKVDIKGADGDVFVQQPTGSNLHVVADANSGVDIGDVTINNAAGASAVNIQDGGNSITVDGTVTITPSGTQSVNVAQIAATATTVNDGSSTAGTQRVTIATGGPSVGKLEDVPSGNGDGGVPAMAVRRVTPANSSTLDGDYEMLQMSAGRLWVDASGVTLDTELPTAAALADDESSTPTVPRVGAIMMGMSAGGITTQVDRARLATLFQGNSGGSAGADTLNLLLGVNLRAVTSGTPAEIGVTSNPLQVSLANTGTPTNALLMVGALAHDAAASGAQPLLTGGYASTAEPTAVSADTDATRAWVDRNGRRATFLPYKFGNMTTATTTTHKSGAGYLHTITVNTGGVGTITVYDNTAGSGTQIALITVGATTLITLTYDVAFATGLTIVTSAVMNITVSYI